MKTLTILRGLPGAGKSTLAKDLVGVSTVRVNKDTLRQMFHFGGIKVEHEAFIKEVEMMVAGRALSNGLSVVVDDTNLGTLDEWFQLGRVMDADVSVREVDTSYLKSLKQYNHREGGLKGKLGFISLGLMFFVKKFYETR